MPIVSSMTGQVLDNVYVVETLSPANILGIFTGLVKMAGAFDKGIPGAIYTISDYATAVRLLGPSSASIDGPMALQALINQKIGGIKVVPVFGSTAASASVTLQDSQGVPGNVLKLTAAQVHPQTGIMTPLLGSDANSMTAVVSNSSGGKFDLQITYGTVVESYLQLTVANMVDKISASSKIVIASLPASPSSLLPKTGTFSFAGGLSGTPGDSDFVGAIDASGNRTGLKSLEVVNGNIVFVAGQSSSAINTAVSTHATQCNCIGVVCATVNTTVANTISAKSTLSQDNLVFVDGWVSMFDSDLNVSRNVAPTSLVTAIGAQNPVYKSWGNKSVYGVSGMITPRTDDELKILQQSNILALHSEIPRGGYGTRSGIASDGSDIYVRAMRYFLEKTIISAMGWAVDEMQSTDANDPLRKDIKNSIEAILSPLSKPLDPSQRGIDSYLVICDRTNNPDDQIAAGKLNVTVKVKLLGTAKQIIISADISQTTLTVNSMAMAA